MECEHSFEESPFLSLRFATLGAVQVIAAPSPATAPQVEVMRAVRKFIDCFNKGDINGALAACAEQSSISDEIALRSSGRKGANGWRITASWVKN